jgi:hypothetical protein
VKRQPEQPLDQSSYLFLSFQGRKYCSINWPFLFAFPELTFLDHLFEQLTKQVNQATHGNSLVHHVCLSF